MADDQTLQLVNLSTSMANNIVPAVELFSIAGGRALMGIERNGPLIAAFEILEEALKRVMKFIVRLTSIGIFVLAASTAGNMNIDQLSGLQVNIVTYAIASLLMTFGVLPALVMLLTSFGYREIIGATKDALLMAIATDNLLIVVPMLSDHGEVETALTNEAFLAQRAQFDQRALEDRTTAVQIAAIKYTAGSIDLLSVLILQSEQLAMQKYVIKLRNAQLANRITLHLALGGSFDTAPATNP